AAIRTIPRARTAARSAQLQWQCMASRRDGVSKGGPLQRKRGGLPGPPPGICKCSLAQARLPENGNEPNDPALTLPEMASPSTLPANSSVIGKGVVMAFFHDTELPSILPSVIACERPCADCEPVPSALISSVEG